MADEEIDILVVVGNPWRSDYLRFAADITPVEGQAFAFIDRDGPARIIVEHPAEAARFRSEQAELDVRWSLSAIEETEIAIRELGKRRIALAPHVAVPYRLAMGPLVASIAPATALLDRLMLRKSPSEIEAFRRAAVLADEGYAVFLKAARVGRPEYALVADVEAYFRSRGCPENFQILGSGGREVRGIHPRARPRSGPLRGRATRRARGRRSGPRARHDARCPSEHLSSGGRIFRAWRFGARHGRWLRGPDPDSAAIVLGAPGLKRCGVD